MYTSTRVIARILVVFTMSLMVALPSTAAPTITNGGFEAGFTGWTRVDQLGSDGTFFLQAGTASPVNGDPVPAPPEGTTAAMTDAQGPGSHVLYQDFLASTANAMLLFDLFLGNRDTDFFAPASLDFSTPTLNQQARVDIMLASADPFSVAAADILQNLYQTASGDPLVSGYSTHSADISAVLTANAGQTLRLRFAETDNVFTFQLGVDDVRIQAAVPEPGSALLLVAALAALLVRRSMPCPKRAGGRA